MISPASGRPRSWLQIATTPNASTGTASALRATSTGLRIATPCRRCCTTEPTMPPMANALIPAAITHPAVFEKKYWAV